MNINTIHKLLEESQLHLNENNNYQLFDNDEIIRITDKIEEEEQREKRKKRDSKITDILNEDK